MRPLDDLHGIAAGGSRVSVDGGRVMPRFMRTFVRHARRFVTSSRPMRAGTGSALAIAFIAGGWLYGGVLGGHGPAIVGSAASTLGLKATDIVITGQVETNDADVFEALAIGRSGSLVGFDAGEARERVMALPWVRNVAIRKIYPGKLMVAVAEKRAAAVWQHRDVLTVVEKSGALITKFGIADLISNRYAHLPHLVGHRAAETAHEILPLAARHAEFSTKVDSYIRVADRRWDVQLVNGIRVKLPEFGMDQALQKIARLDVEQNLLERQINVVDLRLSDRIVLRLEADAAEQRAELVKKRLKEFEKADTRKKGRRI